MVRTLLVALAVGCTATMCLGQGFGLLVPYNPPTDGKPIDLKNQNCGKEVEKELKRMAQGNEGDAGLDALTFDPKTGEVRGEGWVQHKHVWRYTVLGARQHQTVYDWTWRGSFKFNVFTGEGRGTFDVGRGVKVKTETIERLLKGDITAILELVPNPGFKKKMWNEYAALVADYERRYGRGNVYFASERFVDWASPETAGQRVISLVASGGASGGAIMAEVSQEAMRELTALTAWLRAKGEREAEATARAILTGRRVDFPFLALKWQTVGYFSQNYLLGNKVGPEIRSTHAAFAIVWKGNIGGGGGHAGGMARTSFESGAGRFVQTGPRVWQERRTNGQRSLMTEVGRTAEYVELYDVSRRLGFRLYADHAEIKERPTDPFRRYPRCEGKWVQ